MAPGFICNGNCGIEAMLKAVKTISYGFLDLDIRLVRLEGVADDVVTATATTTFTITEAALQHTFPHLVGETGDWSQLANKLLGQRIVTEGVTTFLWDVENERVIRMETKSDLMTPLVRILGGLDDASRVFQNALLTPEGYCSDSFAS
ncbi:hypothetical protein PHYBOEH_008783 [Phytophthora boehmeriae]|uniref:Bzip transcription factor n=1 Tax=Phytophthora boehmeriae TaxID=109152 RepID=A0A8T1VXU9_9STRA|nr:hypothetical protein PHYBOEH_008783 [Phytophthora boehmeriae]